MGGVVSSIHQRRTHQGPRQHPGRLIEQTDFSTGRVVFTKRSISDDNTSIQAAGSGPVCVLHKQSGYAVLHTLPPSKHRGHGCLNFPLASRSSVCFSSDPTPSKRPMQNQGARSVGHTDSPLVASMSMVLHAVASHKQNRSSCRFLQICSTKDPFNAHSHTGYI